MHHQARVRRKGEVETIIRERADAGVTLCDVQFAAQDVASATGLRRGSP